MHYHGCVGGVMSALSWVCRKCNECTIMGV